MSAERKLPSTSIDAYKALDPRSVQAMYAKIIGALKVLGTAHYEELADYIQCREPQDVARRLSELERMQMIWKPGGKRLTKRKRNAFLYQLTGDSQPKTEAAEKALKADGKDLVAISKNIQKLTGSATVFQPNLFNLP